MKRFKKLLALMMAVIMVVGVVNLPAKEAHAAENVTLQLGNYNITDGFRYQIELKGFSTEQLNAMATGKHVATLKVNGTERMDSAKTLTFYNKAAGADHVKLYFNASMTGVGETGATVANWKDYVVTIPKGSDICGYTVAEDLTFSLVQGVLTEGDINEIDLTLGSYNITDGFRYQIELRGFTTNQLNAMTTGKHVATLNVNGTERVDSAKTLTFYNKAAGADHVKLYFNAKMTGVGETADAVTAWKNYVVTIPKGTDICGYVVKEDLTFSLVKGTLTEGDVNKVNLTLGNYNTTDGFRYQIELKGFTTDQLNAMSTGKSVATLKVNGTERVDSATTLTFYNRAAGADHVKLYFNAAMTGVGETGATVATWKNYVVTIPAGSNVCGYTVAEDLTFTLMKGTLHPGDVTNVNLTLGNYNITDGFRYQIELKGFTTDQLNAMTTGKHVATLQVNGTDGTDTAKNLTFYNRVAGADHVKLYFNAQMAPLNEPATATVVDWAPYVVTIPAGSDICGYKVEQDLTFSLLGGSLMEGEMDTDVTLTFNGEGGAQDGASTARYWIKLDGASLEQMNIMHQKKATLWIDGVEKTGASQFYKVSDDRFVLFLYYSDLEAGGILNAADLQGHTVQIKKGTSIGGFNLTNDITFYVKQTEIGAGELQDIELNPGDVLIENPTNEATVGTTFKQALEAGSTVTFDVELNEARNFGVWLLAEGDWNKEYFAKGYSNTDKVSVTVPVPTDAENYKIMVGYRDENHTPDTTSDKTGMKAVIRNLTVHNSNVAVGWDGTVTLSNPTSAARADYICDMRIPTGATVTFDTEISGPATDYAVWIYDVNDDVTPLHAMGGANAAKKTFTYASPNAHKGFRIHVQFRDAGTTANYSGSDLYDCVMKLTNLKVTVPVGTSGMYGTNATTLAEGGTVLLEKTSENANTMYYICNDVKAGSTISFDMDTDLNEEGAVFVIGGDETSFLANGYISWNGKTTYTAEITKDTINPRIQVQYRGDNKANTGYVTTLTNIQVTPPETIYTQQTITGVHSVSTMYNAPTRSWIVTLILSEELADFNADTYYHSLKVDVDGDVRYVRAETVPSEAGDTNTLIRFTLSESDFPNGIQDNTIVTVCADKAVGYTENSGGLHYQKNGAGIAFVTDTKVYLNEIGAALGGYLVKRTPNVTPTLTGYTASELYLAFESEVPVGRRLIAEGEKDGIYLNGTKLSGAYITCTDTGAYTLSLGQNAGDGDRVVIMGTFATENGNYKVAFATTQFTYTESSASWEITEYIPLGSTGVFGDANGSKEFNAGDLVRYLKLMQEKTNEINMVDGDLNGSGFIDEGDKALCKQLLLDVVTFKDGSNITPGVPTYEGTETLAIGAYCGPRRVGPISMNGANYTPTGVDASVDYRTAAEFAKYAAAGFNFVISDNDALYDYNWTKDGAVAATGGFAGSDLQKYMQAAASANVDVIVANSSLNGMLRGESSVNSSTIMNMMNDLSTMDNFKGIFMADEPNSSYLTNYEQVAAVIKSQAPDTQLFTSLLPTYNTVESNYQQYLTNYSAALGFLNYDFYPFKKTEYFWDQNPMNADWFKNLELTSTVGHGNCDTGVTIQSMAHEPTNGADGIAYREVTQKDISFQVYSALAYGKKTLTYYTYWSSSRQSDAHTYTQSMVDYPTDGSTESVTKPLYGYVKNVNEEIKKFENVYMDFTWQGTIAISKSDSDDLLADLDGTFASGRIKARSASRDAIIGCLKDSKGYDGFMLVNATNPADNRSTEVSVTFNNADRAIVYVDGVRSDVALSDGKYTATLAAGEGVFVIPYVAE